MDGIFSHKRVPSIEFLASYKKETEENDDIIVLEELPSSYTGLSTVTLRKKNPSSAASQKSSNDDERLTIKRSLDFTPTNNSRKPSDSISPRRFYGGDRDSSFNDLSCPGLQRPSLRTSTSANTELLPQKKKKFFKDQSLRQKYFASMIRKYPAKLRSAFTVNAFRPEEKKRYSELLKQYCTPLNTRGGAKSQSPAINKSILSTDATFRERKAIEFSREEEPLPSKIELVDLTDDSKSPATPIADKYALVPRRNSFANEFSSQLEDNWMEDLESSVRSIRIHRKTNELELESGFRSLKEDNEGFAEKAIALRTEKIGIRDIFLPEEVEIIEEEEALPEITDEMESIIQEAFKKKSDDDVLIEAFNQKIIKRDIRTLGPGVWLNDQVINFYLNMIVERSKERFHKCYTFNTFFLTKLLESGHAGLKRWTRKIDIFENEILLVPVHLAVHWCMAVIDFSDKSIRYYDSMGTPRPDICKALLKYLKAEAVEKKKSAIVENEWTLDSVKVLYLCNSLQINITCKLST
ncbi:hypothetical protein QYM36_009976, partial [Artemia franciscana]